MFLFPATNLGAWAQESSETQWSAAAGPDSVQGAAMWAELNKHENISGAQKILHAHSTSRTGVSTVLLI